MSRLMTEAVSSQGWFYNRAIGGNASFLLHSSQFPFFNHSNTCILNTCFTFYVSVGESFTVKSAHSLSTFSGFFGPPFLFSLTMNFSLKNTNMTQINVFNFGAKGLISVSEIPWIDPWPKITLKRNKRRVFGVSDALSGLEIELVIKSFLQQYSVFMSHNDHSEVALKLSCKNWVSHVPFILFSRILTYIFNYNLIKSSAHLPMSLYRCSLWPHLHMLLSTDSTVKKTLL